MCLKKNFVRMIEIMFEIKNIFVVINGDNFISVEKYYISASVIITQHNCINNDNTYHRITANCTSNSLGNSILI